MNSNEVQITLRLPVPEDAVSVSKLISHCPPLDTNSLYCNLLHCSHFAQTSIAAFVNDELVGFISAYLKPQHEDTLFVWQVAVSETARGYGLATSMLSEIINRTVCKDINRIETTITKDNQASWALFEGFAKKVSSKTEVSNLFDKNKHFSGIHETEYLVCIKLNHIE